MADSNNNQSTGFISSAVKVAKKLSSTGSDLLNQATSERNSKNDGRAEAGQVIEGTARAKSPMQTSPDDHPEHILRDYVPKMSRQLLGRRYNQLNTIGHFISPQISNKISDYMFERLNDFSSQLSSVERVLSQAGAGKLEELEQDPERAKRLSQALAEQNKWIASAQGAVSGATGLIGAAVDVPVSLLLVLRTIYQTGRSHGFELKDDQEIVQQILRQVDMGLIAEKQTILMGIKALGDMLKNSDVSQLQQLLGSSNDFDLLKGLFKQDEHTQAPNPLLSKLSVLSKFTPLAGATISAVYSWRLVEDARQKAEHAFSDARIYLKQHEDSKLSVTDAYQQSENSQQQASSLLKAESKPVEQPEPVSLDQAKEVQLKDHDTIAKVKVQKKPAEDEKKTDAEVDREVQADLEHLAEDMVEPHQQVAPQKTAVPVDQNNPVIDDDELIADNQTKLAAQEAMEHPIDEVARALDQAESTPDPVSADKTVTKKATPKV